MSTQSQSIGEIQTALGRIRQILDSPAVRAKWDNASLLNMLGEAYSTVMQDIFGQSDAVPLSRYAITTVADQRYYWLPAIVGEIRQFRVLDSAGNLISEIVPRSLYHPGGCLIRAEAGRLYVEPTLTAGHQIEVWFVPSGDVVLHVGEALPSECTASTFKLRVPTSPALTTTVGAIDRRPNAYLGCTLSVLATAGGNPSGYSYFPIQQRVVSAYAVATGTLTVAPDFDFNFSAMPQPSVPVVYEVYPLEVAPIWPTMQLHVARTIAAIELGPEKFRMLDRLYAESKRAVALRMANFQTRTPHTMNTQDTMNPDLNYFGWE